MPLARGDMHAVFALMRVESVSSHEGAHVVIEHHIHAPAEKDVGFSRMAVTVDGKDGAWEEEFCAAEELFSAWLSSGSDEDSSSLLESLLNWIGAEE